MRPARPGPTPLLLTGRVRPPTSYCGVKLVERCAEPTVASTTTVYPIVGLPIEKVSEALPPPSVAAVNVWSVVL